MWKNPTYHDRTPCSTTWESPRGVGRDSRALNQCAAWSRDGPHSEVNEAIRAAARSTVTNSHDCTEPQSWPTRWTGRPGLTASATARKSSVSFSSVKPPRSGRGAVDRPWPRTSYATTWKRSASRSATGDHTALLSG